MNKARITVPLYRAAHGRTGDKGNRSNISVIAWHPDSLPRAAGASRPRPWWPSASPIDSPARVQRFELPGLAALNFVLDEVLDGGVNDALNLDTHGKALSFWLLDLPIEVPAGLAPLLAGPALTHTD